MFLEFKPPSATVAIFIFCDIRLNLIIPKKWADFFTLNNGDIKIN